MSTKNMRSSLIKWISLNWTPPLIWYYYLLFRRANEAEELVKDIQAGPDDGDWHDNGISKGKFPTRILYRLEEGEKAVELRARVETPIQKDLLVPLICVLNETQLFKTWLPNFKIPKMIIQECEKIKQAGKLTQILYSVVEFSWPMAPREMAIHLAAFDNIDAKAQFGIKVKTIYNEDDEVVPEADPKKVCMTLDGGFLFEKCPEDHPCMKYIKDEDKVDGEDMILVIYSASMNPHLKFLPQSLLNFLIKIALATAWKMLLQVAKGVRDGKRLEHQSAMEEKKEFYDYIRKRIDTMLSTSL